MGDKIMLLDGHSLLNRAFYGLPDLTNAQGKHTGGVLGFLNIMLRYVEEEKPTHLLAAFDRKEPTFRHLKYKEYKGTRKPMPKELHEQVPILKEVLAAMEIPVVTQAGIEADDILGTIGREAEREGYEAVIVSGDRDLLQLATKRVKIKIPKTKASGTVTEEYYAEDVQALYGVTPEEFIDMKGLMGDASDNIPGVPGIGEKTAAKLIGTYHSIENAHAHLDEIKPARAKKNLEEYYEQALLSKELATIKTDCALDYRFGDAKLGRLFTKEAYRIFHELELKSLFKYFAEEEKEEKTFAVECVTDAGRAGEILALIKKCGEAGLALLGTPARCRGLSLSWEDQTALFLAKGKPEKTGQLSFGLEETDEAETADGLPEGEWREIPFALLKAGVRLVVPDYKELLHCDGRLRDLEEQIDDAGLAAYLLNPLQSSYACDDLARVYLGETLPTEKEIFGKEGVGESFDPSDAKKVSAAACFSRVPLRCAPILRERLKAAGMDGLYRKIEMPTAATLYDMERFGVRVKEEALREYGEQLVGRIRELTEKIYEQAGKEFNIHSPKQLGAVLFEDLKLPNAKKTKTGYSTSADVLERLAPDYPIVGDVLEYRQLTKLKSTYADGLAAFIGGDGRIHGKFHQKVTATGRLSSSDPNLQNIPIRMPLGRAIRKVFVPEDGYVFVSADYSQIELRILAHMAGDEHLIDAYRHGADIHTATASQVFGVPAAEVTPLLRRNAKAVNFGIVYGISAFGLSQDLNITRKEAEDYIHRYFATYPGIKAYLDGNVAYAKEHGFVKTLYGRIRPIPELSSGNYMQRSFGERAAMNSSIQGTAADIIKIAMIRVSRRLREEHLSSRLILQIHDELLIEAKRSEAEYICQILEEEMTGAAKLRVPLSVDTARGETWYEAK